MSIRRGRVIPLFVVRQLFPRPTKSSLDDDDAKPTRKRMGVEREKEGRRRGRGWGMGTQEEERDEEEEIGRGMRKKGGCRIAREKEGGREDEIEERERKMRKRGG